MQSDEDGVIQTFVFENVEVQKTGRRAEKTLKSGKVNVVVEITPTDSSIGNWRKWVSEDVLFEVK